MTFLASSKGDSSPGAELDMENPTSMHKTNADYRKHSFNSRRFVFNQHIAFKNFNRSYLKYPIVIPLLKLVSNTDTVLYTQGA